MKRKQFNENVTSTLYFLITIWKVFVMLYIFLRASTEKLYIVNFVSFYFSDKTQIAKCCIKLCIFSSLSLYCKCKSEIFYKNSIKICSHIVRHYLSTKLLLFYVKYVQKLFEYKYSWKRQFQSTTHFTLLGGLQK